VYIITQKCAQKSSFRIIAETSRYFSYFWILFHNFVGFFRWKDRGQTLQCISTNIICYVFNTHFTGSKTNIFDVFSVFGFKEREKKTLACDINLHNLIITFFVLLHSQMSWKIMSYDLYWTERKKIVHFWHQQGT